MPDDTTNTSTSSSNDSSTRYSVFDSDYHYIPTSKSLLYDDDFRTKTYFQLGDATTSAEGSSNNALSGLLTSNSSSSTTTNVEFGSTDFWELIVTEFEETHAEKFSPYNTLSEAFMWVATGPKPVEVSITGMVMVSQSNDYRTNFLYRYAAAFRAKQLSSNEKALTLVVKDTTMRLIISGITVEETTESPDLIAVSITGSGYKYRNVNSQDADLIKSYYGTTTKVPTSASDETKSDKKTDSTTDSTATTTTATETTTAAATPTTVADEQKNTALGGSGVTVENTEYKNVTYKDSSGSGEWLV